MLRNEKIFMNAVTADSVADFMNHNCAVLMKAVNRNTSDVEDLMEVVTKLSKKTRHKASKLSLFMAVAAGVAYVVKNERDKKEMSRKLIETGKSAVYRYEPTEEEGDATDPLI